jgi:hypothetical protein
MNEYLTDMAETWPDIDRRDPVRQDRRQTPRGGRRITDLPHPISCPNCGQSASVRGVHSSKVVRWCHCQACGEVWPWAAEF